MEAIACLTHSPLVRSLPLLLPLYCRVLIPFGIDSKKAAVGRWAEAFRLVLSPQAASPSEKQGSTSSAGDDGHETYSTGSVEANEPSGGTSMTLPGGVWDAVRVRVYVGV